MARAAGFAVAEKVVPSGWVLGAPTDLLDVWTPTPLVLRAPAFRFREHSLQFALADGESTTPRRTARRSLLAPLRRQSRDVRQLKASELGFDVRFDANDNVAHILQNQIAVLLLGLETLGLMSRIDDVRVFVNEETPGYALDLFRAFQINVEPTGQPVHGALLTMAPKKFPRRSVACRLLRSRALEVGLLSEDEAATGKIFIARRGRRSVTNAEAVESILSDAGFRTVFAEDLPVREQVRLIAGAEVTVGLHGAALAFAMLRNPTQKGWLVECFSGTYASGWARSICDEVGLRWLGLQGVLTPPILAKKRHPRQGEADSYALAPETLRSALRLVEEAGHELDLSPELLDRVLLVTVDR